MGRKKKPESIRVRPGKYQGIQEPKFEKIEETEPPDWLDDLAKQHWLEVAPQLANHGLLSAVDLESLGQMCEAYSVYRQAVLIVQKDGIQYYDKHDNPKEHPMIKTKNQALDKYNKIARDFGIIAANRRRVNSDDQEKPSKLKQYLEQQKEGE